MLRPWCLWRAAVSQRDAGNKEVTAGARLQQSPGLGVCARCAGSRTAGRQAKVPAK